MPQSEFYDVAKETMPMAERERYLTKRLRDIITHAYNRAPDRIVCVAGGTIPEKHKLVVDERVWK